MKKNRLCARHKLMQYVTLGVYVDGEGIWLVFLWVVTSCWLIVGHKLFGGAFCLWFQSNLNPLLVNTSQPRGRYVISYHRKNFQVSSVWPDDEDTVTSYQTTPFHRTEDHVVSMVCLKEILFLHVFTLILHQSRISVCNDTRANIEGT